MTSSEVKQAIEAGGVVRLVFEGDFCIDALRVGGRIVGGDAPQIVGMYLVWSSVEVGKPIQYVSPQESVVRVSALPLLSKQVIQ